MDHKSPGPEPSTSLDPRLARSRAALGEALLALLHEKPFDQITVREIARTADVGYATFFRHYADKDALLNELASGQLRAILDMALPILFGNDTRAAAVALCETIEAHRKLWSALLTGGAAGTVRAEMIRQARQIAAERPPPETWLPGDLRVVSAVGGAFDVLAWWLQQAEVWPVERIAEILDRLVILPTMADAETARFS
jgi:AcrR family transcriptional regulator